MAAGLQFRRRRTSVSGLSLDPNEQTITNVLSRKPSWQFAAEQPTDKATPELSHYPKLPDSHVSPRHQLAGCRQSIVGVCQGQHSFVNLSSRPFRVGVMRPNQLRGSIHANSSLQAHVQLKVI